MEKTIIIFLVTAGISFTGSLQIGPLSLTVVQTVLKRHLKAGLLVALGGCIPEFIYATAAVRVGMWLEKNPEIWRMMEWASIPILILIGVMLLRTSNQPIKVKALDKAHSDVLKGFTLAMLNPQLFPYWLFILVQFQGYKQLNIEQPAEQIAYAAGASLGAACLLSGVAYFTNRYREKLLNKLGKINLNKVLGGIFILLALIQLFKLMR